MPSYPLASRAASHRKFRRSLSRWIEKLFICADEADVVYDDDMMGTLLAWISAMSSSAFRAFRHTSTLIALLMVEQVNRMTSENRQEIKAAVEGREAEKRKGPAKASRVRLKDLDDKVQHANQVKKQLDGFHSELFDTVFIHRYRDSDELIRSDCISELGRWMKGYPEQYLQTSYFRYLGWVLSDQSEKVRLVVVKCLCTLYARHEFTGPIQQFTERFLPRLIEMATGDVDSPVRIIAIDALTHLDQQDVLDDEARNAVALHIFDIDPRVRYAVATFLKGVLDEQKHGADEETNEKENQDGEKIRWKCLARLLTRLATKVDASDRSGSTSTDDLTAAMLDHSPAPSRISLAVGAVWDADESHQGWSALLELLLYDHSHPRVVGGRGRRKAPTESNAEGSGLTNEEFRLESDEESILIEALGVVLERMQSRFVPAKVQDTAKEMQTDTHSAMTRDLIPVLPRLFKKYRTEAKRIAELLVVTKCLRMDAYLEFQQMSAYESLWDDVIDQFLRHVEPGVLAAAIETMVAMNETSAMSNINAAKMAHVQHTILQSLLESAQLDELESSELEEGHLHQLSACTTRLLYLIRSVDVSKDMVGEEQGVGEQHAREGSAWDILLACAKRGALARQAEEATVSSSFVILSLFLMWSTRRIIAMEEGEEKERVTVALEQRRATLISVMVQQLSIEEAAPVVQRQAFCQLLDLYILYASMHASDASPTALRLRCSAETQDKLANFVKEDIARQVRVTEARDGDNEGSLRAEASQNMDDEDRPSMAFLSQQMSFVSTVSHYFGAIRLGVVHVKHCASLLAWYGRLGHGFDTCLRVLVETIREVGIHEAKPEQACSVLLDALSQAHQLYCRDASSTATDATLVNLAKMLSSALVVRGAQLAVLQSVESKAIVRLHSRGVERILDELGESGEDVDETGKLQKLLAFFKALSQMLISVRPQEAIAIKKSMDLSIQQTGIDVPINSRQWDALRQYEKRLVTIASKSDSVRRHVEATKQAIHRPRPRPTATEQPVDNDDGEQAQVDLLLNDSFLTADVQQLDVTLDGDD